MSRPTASRAPNGLAPVGGLDELRRIAALLSRSRASSPLPPSRLALLAIRRSASVRQTVWRSRRLAVALGLGLGLLAGAAAAPGSPRLAWAGPAPAGVPTVEQLVARIDAQQKDLRSLRAEFVQHTRVKLFRQQISSEGRLLYLKGTPSRLRWEYLRPDASTMLLVGDVATLRMGTRAPQVFDTAKDPTLRAVFTQLRLWLGQGSLAEAQGEYEMSTTGTADKPALVLQPKPSSVLAKTFARIELGVDGRTGLLQRLLLTEQSGDEKEIVFSKTQRNVELTPTLFE